MAEFKFPPLNLAEHCGLAYKWAFRMHDYVGRHIFGITIEDLVSEIILNWCIEARRYDRIHAPATFLSMIAWQSCQKMVKKSISESRVTGLRSYTNVDEKLAAVSVVHADFDHLFEFDYSRWLSESIDKLPLSVQRVIRERINGLTLVEIGKQLGVSKQRVQQIEREGIKQLRKMLPAGTGCIDKDY